MVEKLASLHKKGGKMSETVLWTNASLTSDFAGQAVDLSDNISKYKYISISCVSPNVTCYYTVADLISFVSSSARGLVGALNTNSYYYYRPITCLSDTSLSIGNCIRNLPNGTATTNNAAVKPTNIKGWK